MDRYSTLAHRSSYDEFARMLFQKASTIYPQFAKAKNRRSDDVHIQKRPVRVLVQ